jgi:hypothetical protein
LDFYGKFFAENKNGNTSGSCSMNDLQNKDQAEKMETDEATPALIVQAEEEESNLDEMELESNGLEASNLSSQPAFDDSYDETLTEMNTSVIDNPPLL